MGKTSIIQRFELIAPNHHRFFSSRIPYEEVGIAIRNGFAKAFKLNREDVFIYKLDNNDNPTPLDPADYDMKYYNRHRKPNPNFKKENK